MHRAGAFTYNHTCTPVSREVCRDARETLETFVATNTSRSGMRFRVFLTVGFKHSKGVRHAGKLEQMHKLLPVVCPSQGSNLYIFPQEAFDHPAHVFWVAA